MSVAVKRMDAGDETYPRTFLDPASAVFGGDLKAQLLSISILRLNSPRWQLPTMLQPRLRCRPSAIDSPLASLAAALNALSLCQQHAKLAQTTFVRQASHAAQGRANGPKDSAGRRLGAKKTASQYVIPGNIIFKQRGMSANQALH